MFVTLTNERQLDDQLAEAIRAAARPGPPGDPSPAAFSKPPGFRTHAPATSSSCP